MVICYNINVLNGLRTFGDLISWDIFFETILGCQETRQLLVQAKDCGGSEGNRTLVFSSTASCSNH